MIKLHGNKGKIPWNKDKKQSIETCNKIGKASKLSWTTRERRKTRVPREIRICPTCTKSFEMRITKKKKLCSLKCTRKYEQTEEYKKNQREKAYGIGNVGRESSPEKFLGEILKANNIKYRKGIRVYGNPDFIVKNLCIFVDGEFWHQNKQKDEEIEIYLEVQGYRVLRIPVKKFYQDPTKYLEEIRELV